MKKSIIRLIVTGILTSISTGLWACTFEKGTYELVDNSTFRLQFLPPDPDSAVQLATAKISDRGTVFLQGYVTASQGFSTIYLVPDNPSLTTANISILPLGSDLRRSETDDAHVMIEDLPSQLYYLDPELWAKHRLVGAVWKRIACR